MMMSCLRALDFNRLIMSSLLTLLCLPAWSQSSEGFLNRLLAPGPLIEGHKDLEKTDCLKCHEAGKGVPDAKCLDCHDEIRADVLAGKGFHGLSKKACIACHVDHKGRLFDTVAVDKSSFNHRLTGFDLTGKHAELKCQECHTQSRKGKALRPADIRYFGQQESCVSCHRKDDIHFFKGEWAKKDCNACHGVKTWTADIKFEHARDAKYRLVGRHKDLDCASCHTVNKTRKLSKYDWPALKSQQCLSCHKDQHGNNLSAKFRNGRCDTCHNQSKWKIGQFDHSVTGYSLRGAHSRLQCISCHKQSSYQRRAGTGSYKWRGLKKDCLSCHQDNHKFFKHRSKRFPNPNNCLQCHSEIKWDHTPKFNHNTQTRFDVDGKHSQLKCTECHKPSKIIKSRGKRLLVARRYHWQALTSKTCENCHKSPHKETFSAELLKKKCTECHVTEGWHQFPMKQKGKFDHSQTRFPLTGHHKSLNCKSCHLANHKQVFKFPSAKQKFCVDCHQNPHREQFSPKFSNKSCAECHSTSTFEKIVSFNHDETKFPLKGHHKKARCAECHKATKQTFPLGSTHAKFEDISPKIKRPRRSRRHQFLFADLEEKSCTLCHTDYHKGQLSSQCQSCHNEASWKKIAFDHNKQSDFPLRGKHKEVKCSQCHKYRKGEAVVFDKKRYGVRHFKPISSQCASCHKDPHRGEFGKNCQECHIEKGWKATRDFHKDFTLHGVHYSLQCAECHQNDRRLSGMSNKCVLCHQKDDPHNGSLPQCNDCHRQQFWENADFKHSMSLFPLRGVHRTLDCFSCHSQGMYQGLPSQCISCHAQDAAGVPNHNQPAYQDCQQCHNQFIFSQ